MQQWEQPAERHSTHGKGGAAPSSRSLGLQGSEKKGRGGRTMPGGSLTLEGSQPPMDVLLQPQTQLGALTSPV
jgi:hypothetical protein